MESEIVNITWASLLPSAITIILAFLTRQVIFSLFAGIIVGALVLIFQNQSWQSLDLLIQDSNILNVFLIPSLGSKSYAIILIIYLWCIGGILGMWGKTAGARYFAEHLGKKIAKGPKSSLVFAWILGVIFHQGGTISTILTGTTVKPIADYYKVSHEELSYVVDSTGSPIATLIPFNAWPTVVIGLVVGTIPFIPNAIEAYKIYLAAIPFNFYAIFAVFITLLFALDLLPWIGTSMQKAKTRSRTTGQLDSATSRPISSNNEELATKARGYKPGLIDFLMPIFILLVVSIIPFSLWKMGIIPERFANWTNEAFLLATLSTMIVAKIKGMSLDDIMDGFMTGCKEMTIGAIIIGLAITLGYVTKEVHAADYLIQIISGKIPAIALPGILMVMCMVMAFSTGAAFGTYAVVFPIALPLAYSVNPDLLYLQICFGAVLGGTVFGDQCSPISDTTILSSMFTGCDMMDHVRTQFPLALLAAGLGAITSTFAVIFV